MAPLATMLATVLATVLLTVLSTGHLVQPPARFPFCGLAGHVANILGHESLTVLLCHSTTDPFDHWRRHGVSELVDSGSHGMMEFEVIRETLDSPCLMRM